jgi:hypothetical protein
MIFTIEIISRQKHNSATPGCRLLRIFDLPVQIDKMNIIRLSLPIYA